MRQRRIMAPTEAKACEARPSRFHTMCTVTLDTMLNRTYDLRLEKLKQEADTIRNCQPSTYKVVAFGTRYAFWAALSSLCRAAAETAKDSTTEVINTAVPILVSSASSAHIWLASFMARAAIGYKQEIGHSKPTLASYLGIYGVIDVSYLSIHDITATVFAKLLSGYANPITAAAVGAGAILAGTLLGLFVDSIIFSAVWSKHVLHNAKQQDIRSEFHDFWKGVKATFRPFHAICEISKVFIHTIRQISKVFTKSQRNDGASQSKSTEADQKESAEPGPAKSNGEYAGQLWGIMEAHSIWLQGIRMIFAAYLMAKGVDPVLLVTAVWASATQYAYPVVGTIMAGYHNAIDIRIKENNKSLGLE